MKIHTRIIIDSNTGRIIEDEWFEYCGSLVECKSKTTSQTDIPPPTAPELELQSINAQIAQQQVGAIGQQGIFQAGEFALSQSAQQEQLRQERLRRIIESGEEVPLRGETPQVPQFIQQRNPEFSGAQAQTTQQQKRLGELENELLRRSAEPEPQGLRRLRADIDSLKKSLGESSNISEFIDVPNPEFTDPNFGFTQQEIDIARQDFGRTGRLGEVQDELLGLQLEAIRGGTGATDEQRGLIEQAFGESLALGESDIDRATQQGLEFLTESVAPARGLRPGDTPIVDRGQKIVEESIRQKAQLGRGLRGGQATSLLNFPLSAGQFQTGQIGAGQGLAQSAQAFQQQLQQQAFLNRQQLTGQAGQFGLGLANVGDPLGAQNLLAQQRLAGASTTQKTFDPFGAAQAAGTGLIGLEAAGIIASSRKIKYNNESIKNEEILDRLSKLDVERWRYKGEIKDHIGPYAEDFKEAFGVGDGKTIHMIDAIGVLTAAVQALNKQVNHGKRS